MNYNLFACQFRALYLKLLNSLHGGMYFSEILFLYRKQKFEKGVLLTNGMYSYVRHPLMTFMMLSIWIHPHMVTNRESPLIMDRHHFFG